MNRYRPLIVLMFLSFTFASTASAQQWRYESLETTQLQQKYEKNGLVLPIVLIGAGALTFVTGTVVLLYGITQSIDTDLEGDAFYDCRSSGSGSLVSYDCGSSGSGTRAVGGITMGVGAILGITGVATLIIRSETRRGIDSELRKRSRLEEVSLGVVPTQGGSLLQLNARF